MYMCENQALLLIIIIIVVIIISISTGAPKLINSDLFLEKRATVL